MTLPDDNPKNSPPDRFRNILSDQGRQTAPAGRAHPKSTGSPSINLPKPNGRGHTQLAEDQAAPLSPAQRRSAQAGGSFMPAFWTTASIISLIFNAVLLIAVIGLVRAVGSIGGVSLGPGLLGGLYTNFERMDAAHIQTSIPIQTTIPLDLSIPVQTTTGITLAKDVSIPGAHVRINTALFNIDAPANVTLPAGTSMDVTMGFNLPVQAQVPVNLNVPIDIPIQSTELHPALTGLQDTIRPLYCIVTPLAQTLSGQPVCR